MGAGIDSGPGGSCVVTGCRVGIGNLQPVEDASRVPSRVGYSNPKPLRGALGKTGEDRVFIRRPGRPGAGGFFCQKIIQLPDHPEVCSVSGAIKISKIDTPGAHTGKGIVCRTNALDTIYVYFFGGVPDLKFNNIIYG